MPGQLSGEDKVVICFSLLGLIGSVILYRLGFPPVMVSIFLSAGITALVYRFLGGIQGASFGVGALKLSGTIAALVGIAYWVNSTNQLQPNFHLVSNDVLVGPWEWDVVLPSSSWDGHLDFTTENGQLTFKGNEYSFENGPNQPEHKLLYEITNGKATITNGNSLTLESDVFDHKYTRSWHWRSIGRLVLIPAFVGELRPERSKPPDPNLEAQPWGMLIYKKAH